MLQIHMLQNLYNLSYAGAKYKVLDSHAFSEFCGMESSNQVPDGDTPAGFVPCCWNTAFRSGSLRRYWGFCKHVV